MPLTPIAVMDAQDLAQQTPASRHARLDWLRGQGVDPRDVRRVEVVRERGKLYAAVTAFCRTGEGVRFCGVDHDHQADAAHCQMAEEVRWVRVTSLPPARAEVSPQGPR